jgi:hypothetical protein
MNKTERLMNKTLRLTDKTLRLTDRLVDISFCGLSASLYRAHTVQFTAIMEDMEDFFAYFVLYKIL